MFRPVHPHIRGAYACRTRPPLPGGGSSPHTWGILRPWTWAGGFCRFIPTYVGHTGWGNYPPAQRRFIPTYVGHTTPPGCLLLTGRFIPTYVGHTAPFCVSARLPAGSSPHTWGIRSTPTHIPGTASVHPHIRGAYEIKAPISSAGSGSSPHTWGIRAVSASFVCPPRFIPTYVGHTSPVCAYSRWLPVHPHIRGAYFNGLEADSISSGSSPHTWGIPNALKSVFSSTSVHPHIRGAYSTTISCPLPKYGSSPHTWGIPCLGICPGCASRFIPTYVGHTRLNKSTFVPFPVHPHIRGAYGG